MKKVLLSLCMMAAISAVPAHAMRVLGSGNQQLPARSAIEARQATLIAGTVAVLCLAVVQSGYSELLMKAVAVAAATVAGGSGFAWLIERTGIVNKFFERR